MPQIRRSADRRRRVLYQTHMAPQTPSTAATRRAAEQLRAARQPANSFGSRVHRQLRGRWFSLVPVTRLSMTIVAAVVLLIPIALTVLHHMAVTWPSLAYRESLARPLRIDRPDSFAAWWLTMVLALTAGLMRLIYVLRSHRRDDFRGHYQLWRLTLIVLLVASVHSTTGLVSWVGALTDLLVGDRAVLSGANWLRMLLDVGGIILAMRLVAEVHRCRPALVALLAAAALMGVSEAAAWRIFTIDSYARSTFVIAAPMLGCSCLFVAAAIYLRLLYRQVRNIADEPTLRERFNQWMAQRKELSEEPELKIVDTERRPAAADLQPSPKRRPTETQRPAAAKPTPSKPAVSKPVVKRMPEKIDEPKEDLESDEAEESKSKKPGLFSRFRRKPKPVDSDSDDDQVESKVAETKTTNSEDEHADEDKPKRRWFGLRAAKAETDLDDQEDNEDPPEQPVANTKKKRRFSLRLKPQAPPSDDDQESDAEPNAKDENDDPDSVPKKKGWLSGLFTRKPAEDDDESEDDSQPSHSAASQSQSSSNRQSGNSEQTFRNTGPLSAASRNKQPAQPAGNAGEDDEIIDPDDIDWNSMSKAERRRMRKKLKRSGQAA